MGALSLSVTVGSSTAGLASLIMNILLLIAVVVSGEVSTGGGKAGRQEGRAGLWCLVRADRWRRRAGRVSRAAPQLGMV